MSEIKGIDVSHWNGTINWPKVKAAGVQFAIAKCTDGATKVDTKWAENAKGAHAVGIPLGAYCFSRALTVDAARKEADFITGQIRKTGVPLAYPVYMDVEVEAQLKLGKAKLTPIVNAFCEAVEAAGFLPGLYAGYFTLRDSLDDKAQDKRVMDNLWIPRYNPFVGRDDWKIWQYTAKGKVDGISTDVDLNRARYDYAVGDWVPEPEPPAKKPDDVIADEVIKGLWGSGQDRKDRLTAAGYDYATVQAIVNAKLAGTYKPPEPPVEPPQEPDEPEPEREQEPDPVRDAYEALERPCGRKPILVRMREDTMLHFAMGAGKAVCGAVPKDAVVEVLLSQSKGWSHIRYIQPDGHVIQGWVKTECLDARG